jgi:hypothetical protein
MYQSEIEKIVNLLPNITRGPWESFVEGRDHESGSSFIMTGDKNNRDYDIEFCAIKEVDQDFIALSRNILPLLLEENSRLKKILDENLIKY